MSTSQVLDRTFSLYRHNFLLFAGIAALPPALVLAGELLLISTSRYFSTAAQTPAGLGQSIMAAITLILGGIVIFVLWLVGYAMASGASVYAVSRVHLGHPTGIGECYRIIRPHTGSILGIVTILSVCVFVLLAVGAAWVVIPIVLSLRPGNSEGSLANVAAIAFGALVFVLAIGFTIFLSAKLSLSVPACVLEKLGVFGSLKRSWTLATGTVWRLILVSILAAVIGGAVSGILSIPYLVGIALVVTKKDPSLLFPFVVWQYIANFLAKTLAGPIATVAGALIYYDQRVRKEAFDLDLMMEAIGRPAPSPGAAATYPSAG
jgi:hypothetical protein